MDLSLAKKVLEAFEREGVRYVVCGAVAINILGLPRATEDLDVFIEPQEENVERVKAALRSVFADPLIEEISAEDLLGEYPAVQYVPPEGSFHVDILTRLGEAFRFQDLEAIRVEFDGKPVWVTSPRTLYLMKKDTVRPKDWGDAELVKRRFQLKEE
ncbi:MAG TPA: nucleotidyl transferase AbiEii/AbiGii toxin family protein [Thermoanaerobaculia bacterium]